MLFCLHSIRQSKRPWRFKSATLFPRLDAFSTRLEALQAVFQSTLAFSRLERIELGSYQVSTALQVPLNCECQQQSTCAMLCGNGTGQVPAMMPTYCQISAHTKSGAHASIHKA